jgi:hypothetical protein
LTLPGSLNLPHRQLYPNDLGPYDIPERPCALDRRAQVQRAFEGNPGAPASILTYLEEAYYFVPMFLGLALEQQGEFAAALDWYRTVYDFTLPANQRRTYFGLALEESLPVVVPSRGRDWLLDPLNPHLIAATRRNSYTRFTLLSIVRCLLDEADAEFTHDTSESDSRARTRYTLAQDLLSDTAFAPSQDPCEGLEISSDDTLRIDASAARVQTTAPTNGAVSNIPWSSAGGSLVNVTGYDPPANEGPPLSSWAPTYWFCLPPNPALSALRLHARMNLYKLRNCLNIAGMQRQVDPYSAPTNVTSGLPTIGAAGQLALPMLPMQPTPYRYTTLVDRAKQITQLASQMETAMLAALEKRDAEAYSRLKAAQDARLAGATVQLKTLQVTQAQDGVALAQLQAGRAEIEASHWDSLISTGISANEQANLDSLTAQAGLQIAAGFTYQIAAGLSIAAPASVAGNLASELSSFAAAAGASASLYSARASYERRAEEWAFQRDLANQDVQIGQQQVIVARDQVQVATQEQTIAQIQSDQAQSVVTFLSNKFTNTELYDWMSGVLQRVYAFFLQQATAVAKLAENQLAFERQEAPAGYIQADYWTERALEGGAAQSNGGTPPDRKGLTGSARLLQDIYQLDQYAFETDRRKLQLTKTISLSQLDPFAFQQFTETGVLRFSTPMELFDWDFPGHYLRLIKRVRVSVVALIPPTQGIHATLSTTATTRVVTGKDRFQPVVVRREPQSVALSSPTNASGVFELDPQSELLLPFEGLGVDAAWEFRMPRAANRFDYSTIADVLLTIDYTALESFTYRQQVTRSLRNSFSADRPYSFRFQLADAWYDLHNPDQTTTPMTVRFRTMAEDFPSNIEDIRIQQVVLYFSRVEGETFEVPVNYLHFTPQGGSVAIGGAASSYDGVISTRRGNASSWLPMIGKSPVGDWELSLPDTGQCREWFSDELIREMLFVITYSGRTPNWLD